MAKEVNIFSPAQIPSQKIKENKETGKHFPNKGTK
jgi:hypothetical protein